MVWAFLMVAAVGGLVVWIIAKEEGSRSAWLAPTPAGAGKPRSLGERLVEWSRQTHDRRAATRAGRSFAERFSAADGLRGRGIDRIPWRDRLIALMELILFVVFLSALFATALAAAALRMGHFHS